MKKGFVKFITEFLIASVFIYIVTVAFLFFNQRNMIYAIPKVDENLLQELLLFYDPIKVTTNDGLTLTGFLTPPENESKPVILHFHGNGGQAAWQEKYFKDLTNDGYGVLLAEYRGYAGNPGTPTEQGLYTDAQAFWDSPRFQEYIGKNPIIIYGQSLGSGVAVEMAKKHQDQISGLVLEVPMSSLEDVVKVKYPFVPLKRTLLKDHFSSDEKINEITVPKLFLIAGKDSVVFTESGERLYDLAASPKKKLLYEDALHQNVADYGSAKDTKKFIDEDVIQFWQEKRK